jgi:hypothetical protein
MTEGKVFYFVRRNNAYKSIEIRSASNRDAMLEATKGMAFVGLHQGNGWRIYASDK